MKEMLSLVWRSSLSSSAHLASCAITRASGQFGAERRAAFHCSAFPTASFIKSSPVRFGLSRSHTKVAGPSTGVAGNDRLGRSVMQLRPNLAFERTARQRGWRVPSRLRPSAAAQRERLDRVRVSGSYTGILLP